jgi:hypothetical protein
MQARRGECQVNLVAALPQVRRQIECVDGQCAAGAVGGDRAGGKIELGEGGRCAGFFVVPGELRIAQLDAVDVDVQRCFRGFFRVARRLASADFFIVGRPVAEQVGDVQRAVAVLDQPQVEAIDRQPVHRHLLFQQRHHRHRDTRRVEGEEGLRAGAFRQRGAAQADAEVGPERQGQRAVDDQLALGFGIHALGELGLDRRAVEQRVDHAGENRQQRQHDADDDAENAEDFHCR